MNEFKEAGGSVLRKPAKSEHLYKCPQHMLGSLANINLEAAMY